MSQIQIKDLIVDDSAFSDQQKAVLEKIRSLQQQLANAEDLSILHAVYEQRLYESLVPPKVEGGDDVSPGEPGDEVEPKRRATRKVKK